MTKSSHLFILLMGSILMAAFFLIGLYLLPFYKSLGSSKWVAQILSSKINQSIQVGEVVTNWKGTQPFITIKDLSFNNQKGIPCLHIKKIKFGINLLTSLLKWKIIPEDFYLEGTTINFREIRSGVFLINDMPALTMNFKAKDSAKLNYVMDTFLASGYKQLKDIHINFFDKTNQNLLPLKINLNLESDLLSHYFKGDAWISNQSSVVFTGNAYHPLLSKTPYDWLIKIKNISIKNKDIALFGFMNIFLPHDFTNPYVQSQFRFNVKDLKNVISYYPLSMAPKGVVTWLEGAIKGGEISSGLFLMDGPLKDFPFDRETGTYLVSADVVKGVLNYHPVWPPLNNIKAHFLLNGRKMVITSKQAEIRGVKVQAVEARIDDLRNPLLVIAGKLGTTLQGQRVSLQKADNHLLKFINLPDLTNLDINGKWNLSFHLKLPLDKTTALSTTFHGLLNLQQVSINAQRTPLFLSNLQGQLRFADNSLQNSFLVGNLGFNRRFGQFTLAPRLNPGALSAKSKIGIPTGSREQVTRWSGWGGSQGRDLFSNPFQLKITQTVRGKLVQINLQDLKLNENISLAKNFSFQNISAMTLFVSNLHYKDKQIKNFEIALEPKNKDIIVKRLSIKDPLFNVKASGVWRAANSHPSTHLKGEFTTSNLGAFMDQWHFTDNIRNGLGSAQFNIAWDNGLFHPESKSISGSMNLQFNEGRIIKLSPSANMGIDLGKIITLLNLETETLKRRLKLDFSDLTQSGFSFDSIVGTLQFRNSSVYTKDMVLSGPVATILARGKIGIIAKNYDLDLVIDPKVTSSLPVMATVTAGPIAGLAAWVANKIFSKQVNQMIGIPYHITGTWDNPSVNEAIPDHLH
jgi:uncharacterized protein YhdP